MCGIAGRFHPTSLACRPEWHVRASGLLAHRGPDGQGHYLDEYCELVHRRLAIVDLSENGLQPQTNETGDVIVVFNGEIYNHRSLRARLEHRGHRFRSSSDTEVLVHLYEEAADEMVEQIQGMFAFAIYDKRRRNLLLVRDRFGIKPLFYTFSGGECVFASEIKAILATSSYTPGIDRQACYDYLGLSYVPEPATGFKGIHALPPGRSLTFNSDGESRLRRYYQVCAKATGSLSLRDAAHAAAEAVGNSLRKQSLADVPVAALLSGGIDSSLVVAAYCQEAAAHPTTFNVQFPDSAYDETELALCVSQRFQTDHHTIDLRDMEMTEDFVVRLLRHFDQPFADPSLIPMYCVAKSIRDQGIICALSGDGGDEGFGGYSCFWRMKQLVQLMGLPAQIRKFASYGSRFLEVVTADLGRQLRKATQLAEDGADNTALLLAGLTNYLYEDEKEELVLPESRSGLLPVYWHYEGYLPKGTNDLEELSRRMTETLFSLSLPSDMLRKVDMMSMLARIEIRVPMLDEEVIAVALTLPHHLKASDRMGKLVLRSLAKEWLPDRVVSHPKHGFDIPLDRIASRNMTNLLRDLLLEPGARIREALNMKMVHRWVEMFSSPKVHPGGSLSRGGLQQRLLVLLALELWMREHKLRW